MSLGPAIKVAWEGRKIRMFMPGPRAYQMAALAQIGVNSIKARVAQGVGSNDSAMPPLKVRRRKRWSKSKNAWVEYGAIDAGYPRIKSKAGLKPVRDLYGLGVGWTGKNPKGKIRKGTSHMIDALRVTSASPTQARVDITTQDARTKARANEKLAPWFGFSGRDVRHMLEASRKIWGANVAAFTAGFRGAGRAANSQVPVWMDPLGIGARASQPTIAGQMADRIQTLFGRAA